MLLHPINSGGKKIVCADIQNKLELHPIGVIHTPINAPGDAPVQGRLGKIAGEIELHPEYEDALLDIETLSHLIVLYAFHRAKPVRLQVTPYLDTQLRGLFACRAPSRPNPIGFTVVRLIERQGRILKVEGVDMLNGSPLLDLKPYVPDFDSVPDASRGWLEKRLGGGEVHGDDRFSEA